jgi:hypothetical protein
MGLRDGERYRFFASCCVMVLAPRVADLLEVDPLVLPEGPVFRDDHRALQMLRDPRVRDPSVLPPLRPLTRAHLHPRGRRRVGLRQHAHVGKREVDMREQREGRCRDGGQEPEKELHHREINPLFVIRRSLFVESEVGGERTTDYELRTTSNYPPTTILMRDPTCGCVLVCRLFMMASVCAVTAPPERYEIDAHVSPARAV